MEFIYKCTPRPWRVGGKRPVPETFKAFTPKLTLKIGAKFNIKVNTVNSKTLLNQSIKFTHCKVRLNKRTRTTNILKLCLC